MNVNQIYKKRFDAEIQDEYPEVIEQKGLSR